jgi:hypothetical protein
MGTRIMELKAALEVIRRHRGPVTSIGIRQGDELYYIVEDTGDTYLASDLIRYAEELQEKKEGAAFPSMSGQA